MIRSNHVERTPDRRDSVYSTVFVGAGAAGTGPLVSAIQGNNLEALLDSGIVLVDAGDGMLASTLGKYVVRSDTAGGTFVECLRAQEHGPLHYLRHTPEANMVAASSGHPVSLHAAGAYLRQLGRALERIVEEHPVSSFFPRTTAIRVHRRTDGLLCTYAGFIQHDGQRVQRNFLSKAVVLATGGHQKPKDALRAPIVPGVNLSTYSQKVLLTERALTRRGVHELQRRLRRAPNRKVLIIGGSHSAFSSAWTLLNVVRQIDFGSGDITILHRRKLRLFYPSRDEALREGYTDFEQGDICPLTGRINRLGGLRYDSGELLKRIWRMPLRPVEKRVTLRRLDPVRDNALEIRRLLEEASVIIPAFGYRPNVLPIVDSNGRRIRLLCDVGGPLVDSKCRVLAADGVPLAQIYGIGLASGFVPSGALGGEPNFRGQTNGLWLYQNGVGEIILNQIIPSTPAPRHDLESHDVAPSGQVQPAPA